MLFDAYVTVDWSARSKPCGGKDSVWVHAARWAGRSLVTSLHRNPTTRAAAIREVRHFVANCLTAGERVLVGFDFPFGYPVGFADRLGLACDPGEAPWAAVWRLLAREVSDDARNANNRFAVAARLNRRVTGGQRPGPFWGVPAKQASEDLSMRKVGLDYGALDLAERRLCEVRATTAQPVWKLFGNGSVGGQALLGIAHLERLRRDPGLRDRTVVWPFEATDLRDRPAGGQVVLAEIYPSLVAAPAGAGAVPKDALQVEAQARWLAERDAEGRLHDALEAPARLPDPRARAACLGEEGWIVGVSA